MRLNSKARCAVHLAVAVAQREDGTAVSLGRVSEQTHISRRYLDKLAADLKRAQLLTGRSGRTGGYLLARPAEQISLQDVVTAVLGPINIVECVEKPETCERADDCACRTVYRYINKQVVSALQDTSLAELAAGTCDTVTGAMAC